MKKNNLIKNIRKSSQKRRAVAEVISSLLLVAITVVGAVILTAFLDDTFVSGSLSVSGSDSTIKTIKLIRYDSRDGDNLLGLTGLNNTGSLYPTTTYLCRDPLDCSPNTKPNSGGTDFLVLQIENQSVSPIFVHNVYLDNVNHVWDLGTANEVLNPSGSSVAGDFPSDGKFSIFSVGSSSDPLLYTQRNDNQIQSGESVNLLLKLDNTNSNIPLSKTIRVQFNIGSNQLSEFLIESGGAQ